MQKDIELEQAAQLFRRYVNMKEEERAAVINTGMFNSFIEAYLTITLYKMDMPIKEIQAAQAMLANVLDNMAAADAVNMAKDIMEG